MLWVDGKLFLALPDKLVTLSVPPASQLIALDVAKELAEPLTSATEGIALSSSGIVYGPRGFASFNSSDGKVLISSVDGETLQEIASPAGQVTAVAADGDMLAVGHLDGTLALYQVRLISWMC